MASSSGKPRSRRARNITIVLRRRALALFAILAAGAMPAARGEDAPAQTESGLPKFRFEAVLHDYEPVSNRHERFAEFFYGALAADWTRGDFAAKAEVRGRDGLFRPYYDGSVWLEEGWASDRDPDRRRQRREDSARLRPRGRDVHRDPLFGERRHAEPGLGGRPRGRKAVALRHARLERAVLRPERPRELGRGRTQRGVGRPRASCATAWKRAFITF